MSILHNLFESSANGERRLVIFLFPSPYCRNCAHLWYFVCGWCLSIVAAVRARLIFIADSVQWILCSIHSFIAQPQNCMIFKMYLKEIHSVAMFYSEIVFDLSHLSRYSAIPSTACCITHTFLLHNSTKFVIRDVLQKSHIPSFPRNNE